VTDSSTSLDPKETSDIPTTQTAYRRHLLKTIDPKELIATDQAYEHIHQDKKEVLQRFRTCRNHAVFLRSAETGHIRVRSTHCRLRWCPLCARSRAFFVAQQTQNWVADAVEPAFLTLTLKHSSAPLRDQCQALVRYFKTLRTHKSLRKKIRGGIWFLQVTYNPTLSQWHPHLHILLDMQFVPQTHLSKLWNSITHGSAIVDVRRVKSPNHAAKYVSRYVARPIDLSTLSDAARVVVIQQLHGLRLLNAFGTAHAAKVINRPKFDPQEWQYLGSFAYIQSMRDLQDECMFIWQAWKAQTPLLQPLDVWLEFEPRPPGPKPKPPPPPKQETLWHDVDDAPYWRI